MVIPEISFEDIRDFRIQGNHTAISVANGLPFDNIWIYNGS